MLYIATWHLSTWWRWLSMAVCSESWLLSPPIWQSNCWQVRNPPLVHDACARSADRVPLCQVPAGKLQGMLLAEPRCRRQHQAARNPSRDNCPPAGHCPVGRQPLAKYLHKHVLCRRTDKWVPRSPRPVRTSPIQSQDKLFYISQPGSHLPGETLDNMPWNWRKGYKIYCSICTLNSWLIWGILNKSPLILKVKFNVFFFLGR